MLEGNLSSVFHLFKAVVPIMRRQRFGRIITYGFQGPTMRLAGCIVPLWSGKSRAGFFNKDDRH